MRRLEATFKEVPVKNYSLVNNFANQCTVSSIAYPQGVGKNKKAAKADAAKIAFNIILGFETFEDYGEGMCIDNSLSLIVCSSVCKFMTLA